MSADERTGKRADRRRGAARCPLFGFGLPGVLAVGVAHVLHLQHMVQSQARHAHEGATAMTWQAVSPGTGNYPISDTPFSSHTHRHPRMQSVQDGSVQRQDAPVRMAAAGTPRAGQGNPGCQQGEAYRMRFP